MYLIQQRVRNCVIFWQCTETLITNKQDVCHTAMIWTESDDLIMSFSVQQWVSASVLGSTACHIHYILPHIPQSIVCKWHCLSVQQPYHIKTHT